MTKLTKTTVFKASTPRAETTLDKTTRAVRLILDGEKEQRESKTARLRKARLEREASPAIEPAAPAPKTTRKKAAVAKPVA